VIIDPSDPKTVEDTLKKNAWTPVAVLFTHSHFDHIVGIKTVIENNPSIPIYINPNEKENLFTPEGNLSKLIGMSFSVPKSSNITEIEEDKDFVIESSDSTFSALFHAYFVPGHSVGSTIYEFKAKNIEGEEITWLATGDFLFEGTVGRTDFSGGSPKDMRDSLGTFIKRFLPRNDSNIVIIPGHASSKNSPTVLLSEELKTNPFLKERS
jgi:glyoxylase-like metal-dependent hydrolase (beta-lactamase superfamily II)